MTSAIAAIVPSKREQPSESTTPLVLVNGLPDPDLAVVSTVFDSPLDERRATLHVPSQQAAGPNAFQGSELTIAVPHALSDGEVRWQVLLSGEVWDDGCGQSVGTDKHERLVRDGVAAISDEPIALLGPWLTDELALDIVMHRLAGRIGAELVLACADELLMTMVSSSSPQTDTIGSRLRLALAEAGLSIQQSLRLVDQQVQRTITVLPQRNGRRVSLPWPDAQGLGGAVLSVTADREARPTRAWVARGDHPVVEDTFTMQPGWDSGLQGQPDSDYGRLTSSDFSLYGSVYRAWVLNEDGAYSESPYNLEAAFDVGALFDQPGTISDPLRFRSCLTLSSSEQQLAPIIQSSTDSGANWSAYPGQAEVINDRAGVLLLDDVLPGSILTAAKAGTLRIRVTASLASPDAIEEQRWDGNPFAGPAPTRVLDFEGFAWRSVAPTSIHSDAIQNGVLTADTADDRPAMRSALQDHIAQQPGADLLAKLDLAGAWTALRTGDRIRDALGPGLAIDGNLSGFLTRDARIQRIDFTFGVSDSTPRTRLRLD